MQNNIDIKVLQEMLEQKAQSARAHWDPERLQQGDSKILQEIMTDEMERGNRIVEIPVTVTVRIPESRLLGDISWPYVENLAYDAIKNIKSTVLGHLNTECAEVIADAQERDVIIGELYLMVWAPDRPNGTLQDGETALFDLDRARELYARKLEIERKWNYQCPYAGLIEESFKKLGHDLEANT